MLDLAALSGAAIWCSWWCKLPATGAANSTEALYRVRFSRAERVRKDRLWRVLCRHFLQDYVSPDHVVLDLACGMGEFTRHIAAGRKIAVDLNNTAKGYLAPDVEFHTATAERLDFLSDEVVDVCFSSNFLEHLPTKKAVDSVLAEVFRVLRKGGRYLAIQPNIRYAYREYWDFYDHVTALSDRSCAEAFLLAGFEIERLVPRFLPFTTKGKAGAHPAALRLYLALPAAWRLFGKQFFIVGRKPLAGRTGTGTDGTPRG